MMTEEKKLSIGERSDMAFEIFKETIWYKEYIKPFKDKIQYPDNFMRRIWDSAFTAGTRLVLTPERNLIKIVKKTDEELRLKRSLLRYAKTSDVSAKFLEQHIFPVIERLIKEKQKP